MTAYQEKNRWTVKQEAYLKANYQLKSDQELSDIIGRSLKSIRRKRAEMGLTKATVSKKMDYPSTFNSTESSP